MRVLLIAAVIATTLPAVSLAQTDPDVLKAARECADRSHECRRYAEQADSRGAAEGSVIDSLVLLGRAIGLHYNCNGNEAIAMEARARQEYSRLMPLREKDVTDAIERGIVSISPGECRPLAFRKAMAEYSAKAKMD